MRKASQALVKGIRESVVERRFARIADLCIRPGTTVKFGQTLKKHRVVRVGEDGMLFLAGQPEPLSALLVWGVE